MLDIAYREPLYGEKINNIDLVKDNYFTEIFYIYDENMNYIKKTIRIETLHHEYYTYTGNIDDIYNISEQILISLPCKINNIPVILMSASNDIRVEILLYSFNTLFYLYPTIENNQILYDDKKNLKSNYNILLKYADILINIKQSRLLLNNL